MLRQRIITAVVLLALLLPALFATTQWPFALLTLVLMAASGWEWARLNGPTAAAGAAAGGGAPALMFGAALAGVCAVSMLWGWADAAPLLVWWLATLVWVLGGAWALRGGPLAWPRTPRMLRWGLGLVVLFTAWLALVNAKALGINFILSVFCLAWAADIAAYFGGRAFGRRKLAAAISPGKSWEGVWCGMAGALLLALLWLWVDTNFRVDTFSLYTRLQDRLGWSGLVLVVVFLVAMSVVGDLFESLVKRSAGAKDSSGLLPGHGGLLDRFDALLPVIPIALAMSTL